MGKEVIPDMPDANFSSERRNIANLNTSAAAASSDMLVHAGRELARVSAELRAKKDQEDTLEALQASSTFTIGMAELKYQVAQLPPEQRVTAFNEGVKKLFPNIVASIGDKNVAKRWELQNAPSVEKNRFSVMTQADSDEREVKKQKYLFDLNELRKRLLEVEPEDVDSQFEILDQIRILIYAADDRGVALFDQTQQLKMAEEFGGELAGRYLEVLTMKDPFKAKELFSGKSVTKAALGYEESRNNHLREEQHGTGYAGTYQVGAPVLTDIDVYKFGKGEGYDGKNWYGNKWGGEFSIPGYESVKTYQDFIGNKDAQDAVMDMLIDHYDVIIEERGWDKLIGTPVGDTKVTRVGLHMALHISGTGGTAAVMRGGDSPPDLNDTTQAPQMSSAQGKWDG
jgi:hypothetical protein